MIMAIASVAGLIICLYVQRQGLKILAGMTSFICAWAMIYTGSRTAMVMLPIGLIVFAAIALDKKALIIVSIMLLGGAGLMLKGANSGALYVMSTAFSGADDPSYRVRLRNQEIIRSYIRENPIGFGLGSNSYLGQKYTPHMFISQFPPDSEYVKIAIETGWVGLFLFCTIVALMFGYGVRVYFRTRDPDWRIIIMVCLVIFFMMIVGLYPQETFFISQVMSIIIFAVVAVIAKIAFKLDKAGATTTNEIVEDDEDEDS